MERKNNKELLPAAKALRKNLTKEERRLWYGFLRDYPIKIRRQKILGRYIADFYCASAKLVIELDGSQHNEPENEEKDRQRTEFLNQYDIEVIRIPNNYVNADFKGVCEYLDTQIRKHLKSGENYD